MLGGVLSGASKQASQALVLLVGFGVRARLGSDTRQVSGSRS